MPELPEVETVRRGLAPVMEGARLKVLELRRPDLRFPLPQNMAQMLEGRRILALSRRAKYLLIDFEEDLTLIAHLGMSGSFRIERGAGLALPGQFHHERSKDEKHDHVLFHLEGDDGPLRIIYNDPRRFGFMDLAQRSELDLYPAFISMGPEPVGNLLSADALASRISGRRQPLKLALLDQNIIAGLGNIYVCEALWRARLSPLRHAASLVAQDGGATPELVRLVEAVRQVIDEAIAAGGSSLRDHIQTDGKMGYFQHGFQAYDREGHACQNPACQGIVERIVQSGRSTFYCQQCQI